ncbi:hypothetical protein H0H93_008582 [Arthromyces matolae]|nr:hypothetical protein H0H93_008582 [Arthromyces matolae]
MHTSEDAKNSLCGSLMITPDGSPVDAETENRVKWIATSGFGAGLDVVSRDLPHGTISAGFVTDFVAALKMVACLSQFIMAMALSPKVQARAQKEIDDVIGRDRLPDFSDRDSLPYMECVFKESLRWGTPAPLSVPHRLVADDVYDGYHLPEGTIVRVFHSISCNIWYATKFMGVPHLQINSQLSCRGILHDETRYPDPESFKPERFEGLNSKEAKNLDPENFVYGFGRRRCPGHNFGHSAVWFSMVGLLATFNISPDLDENGEEIPIKVEFEPGAIR